MNKRKKKKGKLKKRQLRQMIVFLACVIIGLVSYLMQTQNFNEQVEAGQNVVKEETSTNGLYINQSLEKNICEILDIPSIRGIILITVIIICAIILAKITQKTISINLKCFSIQVDHETRKIIIVY